MHTYHTTLACVRLAQAIRTYMHREAQGDMSVFNGPTAHTADLLCVRPRKMVAGKAWGGGGLSEDPRTSYWAPVHTMTTRLTCSTRWFM